MRLMAMKLHGDETPDTYQLEPKLIVSDMLKADTNMDNLDQVIEGWRVSDEFNQPWMDELRAQNGK
jgi:simple sugar transport system substrate-binding protein